MEKTMERASAPKRTLAQDVSDVMRLIEDFGALLLRETAALKKADFKAVGTLQPSKRDMATKYQNLVTSLAARKAEIGTLDAVTRERLINARTQFTVILADNLKALDSAKNSTRRLVGKILDAARKSVVDEQHMNYSGKGQPQAFKTSTLALSVDRKL